MSGLLQLHQGQVGAVDPDPAAPPLPGGAAEVVRFLMEVPQWIQVLGIVVGAAAGLAAAVLAWRHRERLGSWIAALPAAVKAVALAAVVGAGAVASVAGYQIYDFVEHDNRFCSGCHVMAEAYVRFEESPHAALGCKECHAQPKTESARQLYLWIVERPHEVGPHSPVPDARCTSCHVDGDPEQWPQIAASLGHRVHFESDDPDLGELMCVTCHGVSVHEFTPAQATCGECHGAEATVRLGRMASETELHCVACHDFLADRPTDLPGAPQGMALLPERAQCVACHEMTPFLVEEELDADPHGAVCGACHNPHTQDAPHEAVERCLECHQQPDTLTVFHTGTHAPVLPACAECHSAHGWTVEGSDCLSCHETILGETRGAALRDLGDGNRGNGRVQDPGNEVVRDPGNGALRILRTSERTRAPGVRHVAALAHPALPTRDAAPPVLAVEEIRAPPLSRPDTLPSGEPRPFLHRQHQDLSCTECHGRADEHGVVTVRTERECAACHHDPRRGYDCEACHAPADRAPPRPVVQTLHLTVWEEARPRELPFDHQLHEGMECQECHTGPVMLAVERECAACHEDHHRPEADCARCHLPAEPEAHGLEVHLTCTSAGCHAGEAGERPTLSRTLCLACHTEERDHEPGLECQRCHMVPDHPPARRGTGTSPAPGARANP